MGLDYVAFVGLFDLHHMSSAIPQEMVHRGILPKSTQGDNIQTTNVFATISQSAGSMYHFSCSYTVDPFCLFGLRYGSTLRMHDLVVELDQLPAIIRHLSALSSHSREFVFI